MKFGIIQGRLTDSTNGELQCFPKENWTNEFQLCTQSGYDYIEFFVEETHNPNNPIWTDEGINLIKKQATTTNLNCYSICNDYIIKHNLLKKDTLEQCKTLIKQAAKCNIKLLVLPLFKASQFNLETMLDYKSPLFLLADFAKKHDICLSLETHLAGKDVLNFFTTHSHDNIFLTYDTGNCFSCGHDIYSDISLLYPFINHVHIKDKNLNQENVCLGEGQIDFNKICYIFKKNGYNKAMTFETSRGNNPLLTAKSNIKLIKGYLR